MMSAEIEKLTNDLQNLSTASPISTLLSRANHYISLGNYNLAYADIRTALSIDSKNEAANTAMQTLLQKTNQELANKNPSIASLIVVCCSTDTKNENNDSSTTTTNLDRKRFEAAQRLAVLSNDEKTALQIGINGSASLIMSTFISHRKDNGYIPAPSIQIALLKILVNISQAAVATDPKQFKIAEPMLKVVNSDAEIELVFGTEDDLVGVSGACDLLSNLIAATLGEIESAPHLHIPILLIIKKFITKLKKTAKSDEIAGCYMTSLIKSIGNKLSAQKFFDDNYKSVLELSVHPVSKICAMVPILLSRVFEYLDPDDKKLEPKLQELVADWIEDSSTKRTGVAAISSVFTANSSVGSKLFLKDGNLELILDNLHLDSQELQLDVLNLLSIATTDTACRNLIRTRCIGILKPMSVSGANQKIKVLAASILIKILYTDKNFEAEFSGIGNNNNTNKKKQQTIVEEFKTIILDDSVDFNLKVNALESLVYLTTKPYLKEKIAVETNLLKSIYKLLSKPNELSVQYAVASLIANLVGFRKRLSDEEQQLVNLKKVAGEATTAVTDEEDKRNDDEYVNKRIQKAVVSGCIPALNITAKSTSINTREITAFAFAAIATPKEYRGLLLQQGALSTLLGLCQPVNTSCAGLAAHAMAKIAITTDPNVAFAGTRAQAMIKPLATLLTDSHELRQFEGLLALTNLCSMPDPEPRNVLVVKLNSLHVVETLMFAENRMIRRAATELVCNLLFDEGVFKKYSDLEQGARERLRILIALSDRSEEGEDDDAPTRKAASGGLAILSGASESVAKLLLDVHERTVEVVMGLVKGEDDWEIVYRGVEILKNWCCAKELAERVLGECEQLPLVLGVLVKAQKEEVSNTAQEAIAGLKKWGWLKQ